MPGLMLLRNLESSHGMGLPNSQLNNSSLTTWTSGMMRHDMMGWRQRSCFLEASARAVSHLADQHGTLGKRLLCWCTRWCLPG